MKSDVSALMDGELEGAAASSALDALKRDPELRRDWHAWHVAGDSLRHVDDGLSPDFASRFMARLEDEPIVLAPPAVPAVKPAPGRWLMPLVASVMGISAVAWVAQALNASSPAPTLARVERSAEARPASTLRASADVAVQTVSLAPPAGNMREYVMAHEGASPLPAMQGPARYQRGMVESRQGGGQ